MIKKLLLKIYTCTLNSPEKTNKYQKLARDAEWSAISAYIKGGKFLDIGAGAGYSMQKALEMGNCEVFGIDPNPRGHGVGREGSNFELNLTIDTGYSEALPYATNTFDTVYSSHVLEHVTDMDKSLKEIKRVCKTDGIIIIGVPTATMAVINWATQILFTTHVKITSLFFGNLFNSTKVKWWEIIFPVSHSKPTRWIVDDIINYRIKKWTRIFEQQFDIQTVILPQLYPYPEFIQLFRSKRYKRMSSSVFFICKKR
ncbi:MAG: class I SAM-dependent methyltransferase [Salinivirgaceae bacterium]|nr:class I SAM-dependent methyltransferase [Salinivirgaceae bacterium]